MSRTVSVYCLECDHEHVCPIVYGAYEGDDDVECPDDCEACGESLVGGAEPSVREDFHSDG